jgi:hypothetical protein
LTTDLNVPMVNKKHKNFGETYFLLVSEVTEEEPGPDPYSISTDSRIRIPMKTSRMRSTCYYSICEKKPRFAWLPVFHVWCGADCRRW